MKKVFSDTGRLTFMGVMLAMTIIFVMATVIPSFTVSVAVAMFLPTILTGIVLGPAAGGIMGLLAGTATLLRALLLPLSPFDYFFIHPLVSIFPRIFIGIASYYAFTLMKKGFKTNDTISSSIAAAAGMLTNTLLVIGMLYVVYGQKMVEAMGGMSFVAALGAIFMSNGLIEVISAMIIIPVIYRVYVRYTKMK